MLSDYRNQKYQKQETPKLNLAGREKKITEAKASLGTFLVNCLLNDLAHKELKEKKKREFIESVASAKKQAKTATQTSPSKLDNASSATVPTQVSEAHPWLIPLPDGSVPMFSSKSCCNPGSHSQVLLGP
jgi:hypothetical protein